MRNLLIFLVRYQNFFLFILLEIACLVLIFNYQYYHQSKALSAIQGITGGYYSLTSGVRNYFHLKQINDSLKKANTRLLNRLAKSSAIKQQYDSSKKDTVKSTLPNRDTVLSDTSVNGRKQQYRYLGAKVIFNSVSKRNNYLTLNRGTKDGLVAPMGLTTTKGVVGIIKNVSNNYAVGISILHNDFSLSCEIKENNQIGALNWNGKDPRFVQLQDMPTHVTVKEGQHVVTSPYSRLFPQGLPVGRVVKYSKGPNANFYDIQVRLNQSLRSLHHVYAIKNRFLEEQVELEKAAKP
jgi:rod shape-determining protein MreC